jgi:dynactin 1
MDPPVGSIVSIPQGKGVVRYSGGTEFAAGKWIGVELYEPNGKNDGSVHGHVYFPCKMPYGVFVRQSQIKNIHGMGGEAPTVPAVRLPEQKPRPQPTHQRSNSQRSNSSSLLRASTLRPPGSSSSNASSPREQSPARQPTINTTSNRLSQRTTSASPTKRAPAGLQPRRSIALKSPSSDVPTSPGGLPALHPPSSFVKKPPSTIAVKRVSSPLSLPPETSETVAAAITIAASPSPSTSPRVTAPIHSAMRPTIPSPITPAPVRVVPC